MGKLKGKIAIVTGGARDIGRAISLKLAQEGAKVVVNYNNSETEANHTVEQINVLGGHAVAVRADVSKLLGIETLRDQAIQAFGDKFDILVT